MMRSGHPDPECCCMYGRKLGADKCPVRLLGSNAVCLGTAPSGHLILDVVIQVFADNDRKTDVDGSCGKKYVRNDFAITARDT